MRAVTAILSLVIASVVPAAGGGCEASQAWTGCEVNSSSTAITVEAERGDPGRVIEHNPSSDEGSSTAEPEGEEEDTLDQQCEEMNICRGLYSVATIPDATLQDVASFAPAPASLANEPSGFGVVGLPTNFVVPVGTHTASGTLFDLPVSVRFTPVEVTISPGDGSTVSSSTPGASWGALGLPQFSATTTSHAYRARGVYTASATVHYAAEVNFGTRWRPVDGTIAVPAASLTITVLEARTALVEHTCVEDPSGPGC